jgi:hypothetical protein
LTLAMALIDEAAAQPSRWRGGAELRRTLLT